MLSKFKDAFVNKPQFTFKTPAAVLEALSKDLPNGFRYVEEAEGFCHIETDEDCVITINRIKLPDEDIKIIEKEKGTVTIDDMLKYAYNAQIMVEILPDDDGCVLMNNCRIPLNDIVIAPMRPITKRDNHLVIRPGLFPEPVKLKIEGNGETIETIIQQKPNKSLKIIRFESIDDGPLDLTFLVNTENVGDVTITVATRETDSAKEALASKLIYNAFMTGDVTIDGERIQTNRKDSQRGFPDDVIRFWRKIVKLEEVLGCKFNVREKIDAEQFNIVNELYRSIVDKKPIKKYLSNVTIRGKGQFNDSKLNGKTETDPLMFAYTEEIDENVLGETLHLYVHIFIFNCVIKKKELPSGSEIGRFMLTLTPANNERMFSSTMYYLTEEEFVGHPMDNEYINGFYYAEELPKI